jgi:hypothetical protein
MPAASSLGLQIRCFDDEPTTSYGRHFVSGRWTLALIGSPARRFQHWSPSREFVSRSTSRSPLAWTPGAAKEVEAIEVYPAATLVGRGIGATGYKGKEAAAVEARTEILRFLAPEIEMGDLEIAAAIESDHVLDAMICTLAGLDYVSGNVITPSDLDLAKREGWIWVKPPHSVDE